MTNEIQTSIKLCLKLLLKKKQKNGKKRLFVHLKFFSKEYFESSFKIILGVFYVENFWDTELFSDVSLYKTTFFCCSGLSGWEGCLV